MQFLYRQAPLEQNLEIDGDEFRYLCKVRRIQVGEFVNISNFEDLKIYEYEVVHIDKKKISLAMRSSTKVEQNLPFLHIGWCMVDPKTIEKTLPFLNELGVAKITFIYCKKSQRNFKLNFERMQKILINSCQQCGRGNLMQLESCDSIEEFILQNPNAHICDFGGEKIASHNIQTIIVGPEGGLSECEQNLNLAKIGFDTPLILRSETAVTAIASKILV